MQVLSRPGALDDPRSPDVALALMNRSGELRAGRGCRAIVIGRASRRVVYGGGRMTRLPPLLLPEPDKPVSQMTDPERAAFRSSGRFSG